MFKVFQLSFQLSLLTLSFLWSELSFTKWLPQDDLIPSQYVQYQVEKGDWPVALLRRLDLKPIFGKNGSLEFFFRLNPDLKKSFSKNSKYQMPPGQKIVLPIPKWDKSFESKDYVLKNGMLKFGVAKVTRQTNDYTAVLNLKNLQRPQQVDKRNVASIEEVETKNSGKILPQQDSPQWSPADYDLGVPLVRIPVEWGTPIYKKLVLSGLIPKGQPPRKTVYIEVPLYMQKKLSSESRELAAVNVNTVESPRATSFSILANTFSSTRLYDIKDSNGESGQIGAEPSIGLQVGFSVNYSWLDLETTFQFQKETFRPDQTVVINQESDSRLEARVRQNIDLGFLAFKLGAGVLSTPGFYSSGVSQLQSQHLQRPFAHLGGDFNLWSNSLLESGLEFGMDYILGQSKGLYRMDDGYRSSIWLINRWNVGSSLSLNSDFGFSYQDDNPTDYQQVQQDLSLLLGLEYSF